MYLKQELTNSLTTFKSSRFGNFTPKKSSKRYPSMRKASRRIDDRDYSQNELQDELEQIKEMLYEAKRDMASYKCPTAKELEQEEIVRPAQSPRRPQSVRIRSAEEDDSEAVPYSEHGEVIE